MNEFKNIALVGNPNSGKSSLFNELTGLNQKVGNFPGVTVDKKSGKYKLGNGETLNIIDLPGTYSLYPKSDDELVTYNILLENDSTTKVDLIIVAVDASSLKRNLLFCTQIMDLKKPVIVALTMMDIARKQGVQIDVAGLSRELGVPVIEVNPRRRKGIKELKQQMEMSLTKLSEVQPNDFIDNHAISNGVLKIVQKYWPVSSDYMAIHFISSLHLQNKLSDAQKVELSNELKEAGYQKSKLQAEETLERYRRIKKCIRNCVVENDPIKKELFSAKLDSILLHPIYGNLILLLVLFLLFQSIFWLASYPMEWIDYGFSYLTNLVKAQLPAHFLTDLLLNGVLAGINGVVVFVPQIMILFGLITLLEDSGYMSRISFLSDRLMRSVGLNGKSVMPLISAVACAVPAIMAARTIENKKEKLITILIAPFMSCSARLPVYTILISLVIPQEKVLGIFSLQGLVLMGLYVLGFATAMIFSFILNKIIKVKERSIFLMEMPVYRMPRWNNLFITMVQKAKVFVLEAGKIILIISILLWAMSSYGPDGKGNWFREASIEESYAGRVGKLIEPSIAPLGFDWKIGISLITSFAAREVFVGTMATLYSVDSEDEKTLLQKMSTATRKDGRKVYDLPTGLSLLVFYVFAMQCMSTLAIVKRETNSWLYPIMQFVGMGLVAYLSSFLVYYLMKV